MKRYLILALVAVVATTATAQIDSVRLTLKERLAQPAQIDSLTINNNTIRFVEQGDAHNIVEQNIAVSQKSVSGYRIVIFMSNTQSARRDAIATQESFAALYPTEATYLTYDNPYFKVTVGNYASQEEAIIHLGRIRKSFPKAFLMRENIPVAEFAR